MAKSEHLFVPPSPFTQQSTALNITRLMPQQELLKMALEQLRSVQEELHQKNRALEIAYQTIEQERQQLQAAYQKIREQTAMLNINANNMVYQKPKAEFTCSQKLEHLGSFTSRVIHDLNNIFSPILTISQLLRLRNPNLSEQSQEMLEMLENSAKHGANLTKQILTYSRKLSGEHKPTQITSLLQKVLNTVQLTFQKSIRIDRHLSDQPLWLVTVDSTQLYQILMNLCVNAYDAMSDGGVLTVSAENCFIDQASASSNPSAQVGSYIAITVTDTGTGIPPEVRDRIFEPFFTTKPIGQGTGLGLATVLEIVKSHGGFLQILSEVGQGTSIKVYLPALPEY